MKKGRPKFTKRPFEEAREFARSLGLASSNEWMKYCKSGNKPIDIPRNVDRSYKKEGWIDWYDFLGSSIYIPRPFKEARKFVRKLKINSIQEWKRYAESGNKPTDIPSRPDKVNEYKKEWKDWYDFFGKKRNKHRPFEDAREFARELGFRSHIEWVEYAKSKKKPKDIPSTPQDVYSEDGWIGWPDFLGYLGNGNIWTKRNIILYLESIKPYIHVLSTTQFIAIISSNGLDRYIGNEHLLKFQDTIPNSPERLTIIQSIIKEFKEEVLEELEMLDEEEISDESIDDFLNSNIHLDDYKIEGVKELRQKQLLALDTKEVMHSLDSERVKFIVNDFVNTLWYDELNGRKVVDIFSHTTFRNEIPSTIKEIFTEEYEKVKNLKLPKNWIYHHKPLLMQKLIAYRLKQYKRYGNFSGVGSGKTISAILAGQYVVAKNTLVITFNSTIGNEDERGWTNEIRNAVKNANIYTKTDKDITFSENSTNYLVLNYETFQQTDSIEYVVNLLERNTFDYIILDEVQSIKQMKASEGSKRRKVITGLIDKVKENNPNYYLLAMSATPIINNLMEGRSIIEIIEGRELPEINTNPTAHNCLELFQRLTNCGIRYINTEDNILKDNKYNVIEIEANDLFSKAKKLKRDNFLDIDRLLLETKLQAITPYINASKGKTVIYTYYVDGIDDYIYEYLTNLGYKVGVYTGTQKKQNREDVLQKFIYEDYDVLLGSKPIGTGVDGLQKVADTIIIISLPWTNAEFIQIIGRLNRKGSNFAEIGVNVIIPLVSINGLDMSFRWDYHRFNTITYKKTIANAAVDGIIPDKIIPSREKFIEEVNSALPEWIERLKKERENALSL